MQSYARTYGMETVICRGSNNYGPYQYPEKLIPLMILNALHGDRLPVYGDGHAGPQLDPRRPTSRARSATCSSTARPARSTTPAGPTSAPNIDVVRRIIELTGADEALIEYVTDRLGHDRRYSLSSDKVRGARLGAARALRRRARARPSPGTASNARLVGADPLRRIPRVLRAPVRARARLLTARGAGQLGSCEIFQRLRDLAQLDASRRALRRR